MAEQRHPNPQQQETSESQPMHAQLIKTIAAIAASGSMMLLSGLTLTATIIALTVATPLLVIFSPILVPAAIAVFLIASGFVSSGGFGVAAVSVLAWMYRYVMGEHPVGAGQIDYAKSRFADKAREIKDGAQHRIDQATA